jgi:hypothetical protein
MNKLLASLGCALISFISLNAFAVTADPKAPMVCNAAETAKVCRDYDPKKELVLGGPAQEKFNAALNACAGADANNFSSKRYSDCQDDSEITRLRAATNAADNVLRAKFAFMRSRCDPGWAKARVCGPSVDKQVTSAQPGTGASKSGSASNPTLTRVENNNKPSAEQIAATRKAAEANRKRKAEEAADIKAKEAARKAKAKEGEEMARASCMKPGGRGMCSCARFYPEDKGKGNACGK